MFDQKSLTTLEYPKILDRLATFAQSQGGKKKASELVPYEKIADALHALNETAEADRVLFEYSLSPSFAVDDIGDILVKAKKGATLAIPDIMKVGRSLRVSRRLKYTIDKVKDCPLLADMAMGLFENETLEKKIFDAFLSETEVADNASNELRAIRIRIRKLNDNVRSKLQLFITSPKYSKYLQDNIITVRGDRYVIPVKSDCKGTIPGLVHDQSASGSTLFVEPMQIVELNNELKVELVNEQLEIEKILRNFSNQIEGCADGITYSYNTVVDMDMVFAKAQLAREYKATKPELNEDGVIDIRAGRHPLIDQKKVVPVSLALKKDEKMLLITGPNTGGKTVTLKLVGLFTLMAMSGLFIPAKSANLSIFDGVYSDIGDEQSIEQSLSTFSSHIKNTIGILDVITDKSLVLFDELGAGTDPGEGAALAVSIAEYLLRVGAKSFITSHFNDLKEFSLVTKGVVAASMEFDSNTFCPTYKLVMGAIGSSNALAIAKKLGLSDEIIENAKSKISVEKRQFDNVLTAAEKTRMKAAELVSEASIDRENAAKALKDAEIEKKRIEEKREKLDESIRKETKRLIENSVEEANDILEQIKEILNKPQVEDKDLFEARKLKKQLENMTADYEKEAVVEDVKDDSPLKIGDNVFVKSLQKKGKLTSINQRGEAVVAFGKLTTKVKKDDYYKVK
ncbi:mutS2 protein [Firmicutes bacterium CAG:475]|nr:mutS2 protein [Firmicutes bacterium CAG:475]